jgi:hypothetical protein
MWGGDGVSLHLSNVKHRARAQAARTEFMIEAINAMEKESKMKLRLKDEKTGELYDVPVKDAVKVGVKEEIISRVGRVLVKTPEGNDLPIISIVGQEYTLWLHEARDLANALNRHVDIRKEK